MSRTVPVSIAAFPASKQEAAWRETLGMLSLSDQWPKGAAFHFGEISIKRSPTLATLALLRSTAQVLKTRADEADGVLIGFVHYGRGHLTDTGRRAFEFADGDLWVCDPLAAGTIQFRNDFELLLLRVPRERLAGRIGRGAEVATIVLGESVSAAATRPMMRALAANFAMMEDGELIAAETAITELVLSALLAEARPEEDNATQVQAAHLARVCAQIEARLREPDLSVADIAKAEGLSPRYVQRLFEGQDRAFSDYVRHRRLERCRLDLINPHHADRSIAEIGYRWGFGDQAHFSRVFSAAYGIAPREFRKSSSGAVETRWTRGRPIHSGVRPMRPGPSPVPAPEEADAPAAEARARAPEPSEPGRHHLPVSRETVHWGYLSRSIPPVLRVRSGAIVTVETLTQHAYDDHERMIKGDPGAESVFRWSRDYKAVDRRGAGPVNASIFGRGAGEGFGVHICTGPIFVHGAEPGDVLEVQIRDLRPRPCANPAYAGQAFGSNAASAWGFHHDDLLDEPRKREVVTIYRTDAAGESGYAEAVYSFRWVPQTDPFGVVHETIDYPGIPVDHARLTERHGVMKGVRVPVRPHFGFIAVAPRESDIVDSVPPGYFGGNVDNWRAGKGSSVYLPVTVPGALLSVGDPHLAQGDGEISGTALECSLTGEIRLVLHKRGETEKAFLNGLNAPLIETEGAFLLHGFSYTNYLRELGRNAQSEVFKRSSLSRALRSAVRATRKFLMERYELDEDEAISLMSVAVDFGVTQVADGNWGVHAKVDKPMFPAPER
ncbi:acetamidase/formamidase family protein [Ancylobacter sp. MQZ15Z-1]|uniref:Acetamidase/formamidase family protein n=1 Tax=Ancylobacter mangrovi TaxID=2972472 RepID=A0A9X2PHT5_9HYPH|nr:acetamidase/formamidase family protein [Ancylobacter mangrovi]MCS0497674.1 acetamidase/formamidase family protein [Ancylobacter mangrovi]